MMQVIEELSELVSKGLERLSREDLIENLKEAIYILLNIRSKNIEEIKGYEINNALILYLVDIYCEGKAVIPIRELYITEKTSKGFSIDKQEGKDFLEVTVLKNDKRLH